MGIILYCARLPYNEYPYRYRVSCDNDKIVFGNTDSTKNISANVYGQGNKTFYNSAGFYYSQGGYRRLALTLIATEYFSWYCEYTTDGGQSWNTQQSGSSNLNENGLYAANWNAGYNNDYYYYNANDVMFEITDNYINLPIFNTESEYQDYIMSVAPPAYIWTSVPAISGKMGILSLATIPEEYINNGEAVTGADPSHVNLVDSAKWSSLLSGRDYLEIIVNSYYDEFLEEDILTDGFNIGYAGSYATGEAGFTYHYGEADAEGGDTTFAISNNNAWLSILKDDENEVAKFSIIFVDGSSPTTVSYNTTSANWTEAQMHALWLLIHECEVEDPDDTEDENANTDAGDEGIIIRPDNPIPEPDMPACDAISTGFVSLWKVPKENLQLLSNKLWSDDFWDVIHKFFADPREVITGLQIMPISPKSDEIGSSEHIIAGRIDTECVGQKLLKQFRKITCGDISISGTGNNFFAYPPYTSIDIYLPFCGYHSLDVNDIMKCKSKTGSKLTLKYIFDFLSGTCVALLAVNGSYKYAFAGNCAQQIPVTSADYRDIMRNSMSLGASIGAGMITAGSAGLTAPAADTAASVMNSAINVMNASPHVAFSSGGGSTAGFLQNRRPVLVISEPIPKKAVNEWHYIGKQALQTCLLNNLKGFTKVYNIHLNNIPCTDEELGIIMNQLKSGVIINKNASEIPEFTPMPQEHAIAFFKNYSEANVIKKDFRNAIVVYGKQFYNMNILTPKLAIQGDYREYNYAYMPDFGRFYYITHQTLDNGNVSTIEFKVDALESWKTEILACDAIIERQEHKSNWYMQDGQYFAENRKNVTTLPFVNAGVEFQFKNTSECYIMTVAGG